MKKRLAIIPARGGSKGIPKKNIYPVAGHPLIYYTIQAAKKAQEAGAVDCVIVSTDSEEIAEIAKEAGAEVPFIRPEELASDGSKSADLMIHAVKFYRDRQIEYDDIVLLQPTSPLRNYRDIVEAVELYDRKGGLSLVSCYKEESVSEYNAYRIKDDMGIALHMDHNKGKRRQDLPELFVRNGAVFITDVAYLLESGLVISEEPVVYVMPKERSINIDTQYDMELTEWMMERTADGETKSYTDDCQ